MQSDRTVKTMTKDFQAMQDKLRQTEARLADLGLSYERAVGALDSSSISIADHEATEIRLTEELKRNQKELIVRAARIAELEGNIGNSLKQQTSMKTMLHYRDADVSQLA